MIQEIRTDDKQDKEKLRGEAAALLAQAQNQLADIQRALAGAGGDSALHAKLSAAAAHLSSIVSELSSAVNSRHFPLRGADLISIAGVVQSGEASRAVAESGTRAASDTRPGVAAASAATRQETQTLERDLFDRHIFDPYLHFKSAKDEEEYRQREAETKKYIEQQLAKHTPEGDLNAGGGMMGQMLDAHAHGAGNSPVFMPRFDALAEKLERQRNAMKAAGQSTEEFDYRLDTNVRRFLRDEKGMSASEIDNRMKSFPDPLSAAKSFLKDDRATHRLEKQSRLFGQIEQAANVPLAQVETAKDAPAPAGSSDIDVDAISAKLKAAGVKVSDNTGPEPRHGVNVKKPAAKDGPSLPA